MFRLDVLPIGFKRASHFSLLASTKSGEAHSRQHRRRMGTNRNSQALGASPRLGGDHQDVGQRIHGLIHKVNVVAAAHPGGTCHPG